MVLEVTTFWKELSQEMKYRFTVMSQRVNARVWNGKILICQPRESSKHVQLQEGLSFQFFGTQQGLLLEHYQERGYTVNSARCGDMLCDKLKPPV